MSEILAGNKFRSLIKKHGIAHTARILGRRYAVIRDAVEKAGIGIKRGRRKDKNIEERNQKIRTERKVNKKFLHIIGKKFNIGRERVRQVLKETGGDPLQ